MKCGTSHRFDEYISEKDYPKIMRLWEGLKKYETIRNFPEDYMNEKSVTSPIGLRSWSEIPDDAILRYVLTVRIHYPYIGLHYPENLIEVDLSVSKNEINRLVDIAKTHFWIDDGIRTWEYIQHFSPEIYMRVIKCAEAYTVPKWGERMSVENGAKYDIFLPDEISNLIFESQEFEQYIEVTEDNLQQSRTRSHEEKKLLYRLYEQGRWKDKLSSPFKYDTEVFIRNWHHCLGENESRYKIATLFNYDGKEYHLIYWQVYFINSIELGVDFYPDNNTIEDKITEIVISNGYKKINNRLYTLYFDNGKKQSDIDVFIQILDNITNLI